jgi:hypothetical protein
MRPGPFGSVFLDMLRDAGKLRPVSQAVSEFGQDVHRTNLRDHGADLDAETLVALNGDERFASDQSIPADRRMSSDKIRGVRGRSRGEEGVKRGNLRPRQKTEHSCSWF